MRSPMRASRSGSSARISIRRGSFSFCCTLIRSMSIVFDSSTCVYLLVLFAKSETPDVSNAGALEATIGEGHERPLAYMLDVVCHLCQIGQMLYATYVSPPSTTLF